MKQIRLLGLVLLCVVFTGCVKYRVSLTDGSHFTVLGKPKFDKENNLYRYKSGGKESVISAGRVRAIEPSSNSTDSDWYKKKK